MNVDKISKVLTELLNNTQAEGAILFSLDGFPIISDIRQDADENKISALSASTISLGLKYSSDVKKGKLKQVYIESEHGHILLRTINSKISLALFAPSNAKLGMIFLSLDESSAALNELF